MSFVDQRLPERYAYGAVSSDDWLTEIVESLGRAEIRNAPSANPRRSWDLSTTARSETDRAELHSWFLAMRGQLHSFAFRDLADYTMPKQTIGTGDGSDTTWQLRKAYTVSSATYYRNITKPITSTVRVWVNGVEATSGWSVSRTTGIVTFGTAPTNGHLIQASCEFDVPVRFAQSKLSWSAVNRHGDNGLLWVCSDMALIEVLGE